jgi:hypothetical protein
MARALLLEHGGFRIGERVELTQQGEQQVAGVRSKTGTVMGFGNHSTLHVLVDGNWGNTREAVMGRNRDPHSADWKGSHRFLVLRRDVGQGQIAIDCQAFLLRVATQ